MLGANRATQLIAAVTSEPVFPQQLFKPFKHTSMTNGKMQLLFSLSFIRQGPAMTGDYEKVFNRSLDILFFWIRDCKQVDFTPESKLVDTLEQFLYAEVTISFVICT